MYIADGTDPKAVQLAARGRIATSPRSQKVYNRALAYGPYIFLFGVYFMFVSPIFLPRGLALLAILPFIVAVALVVVFIRWGEPVGNFKNAQFNRRYRQGKIYDISDAALEVVAEQMALYYLSGTPQEIISEFWEYIGPLRTRIAMYKGVDPMTYPLSADEIKKSTATMCRRICVVRTAWLKGEQITYQQACERFYDAVYG